MSTHNQGLLRAIAHLWAKILQHRHIITHQQSKRCAHNTRLQLDIIRLTQGIAEGEGDEEGAWRANLAGDLAQEGERDGGDTGIFDGALDQSHGLIAHGSDRSEQSDIYASGYQAARHLGRALLDEF